MTKKGILTVISGFSGAGKGTIVRELVDRYGYAVSISATTRDPRAGEQDGVHYFFKTKEEFEQMIADGALIEYASYVDNYYGTPKDYVMQKLEQGIDVILEIEMQGALKVKERFPEKTIWCFTGYVFEKDILNRMIPKWKYTKKMLEQIDYLVDGPFVEAKKDITLRFRGSSNQRIIDVKKSLETGEVVLWEEQ